MPDGPVIDKGQSSIRRRDDREAGEAGEYENGV